MKQLEQITVKLSRPFDGLNQASADAFYQATLSVIPLLRDQIISPFEKLLKESIKIHGHLCPGQVLGVRMSMLGLREIGIEDPKGKDKKNIIVFVEIDRCATDAIQSVTGCSLGKRSLKFLDYGKMAATFLNLKTGNAVRILAIPFRSASASFTFLILLPEISKRNLRSVSRFSPSSL